MIDTHCHIDLYPNPEKLLIQMDKLGITIISMTNLPSHFGIGFKYFKSLKKIRLALGMHPLYAKDHSNEMNLFLKYLHTTSYIGEIGLDFSKEGIATKDIQIDSFKRILKSISGRKKILSLHSRKAEEEVFSLLNEFKIKSAIFHWYSGPIRLIEEIAKRGYYFSVNTAMIGSKAGHSRIAKIPKNKILTETDGPFIELQGKPVDSRAIQTIISGLAQIWGCRIEEADLIISNNFKSLVSTIR